MSLADAVDFIWGYCTGADLSVTRYFLRVGNNVY